MIKDKTRGRMLLAADRRHIETNTFRRYQTLFPVTANMFEGPLCLLNNDTLAGGHCMVTPVHTDSEVWLLPTVGAVQYRDSLGNEHLLEAGEVLSISLPAGTHYSVSNPYQQELVNLLHLGISKPLQQTGKPIISPFALETKKNRLLEIFPPTQTPACSRMAIGKFDGRREADFYPSTPEKGVLVLVLEGAFEVQYRLLETGDALLLWDATRIELEALSHNAIVLLMEL